MRKAEDTLTKLGMTTKQDLFDQSLRFEQDELGRTVFNERQILDYAVTHAKDVESMQNYEQAISQMSERKLRLMQVAQQRIEQELRNAYAAEQSALNQEVKLALTRAKAAAEEKAAREKANAQNRASMWSAVTGLAGAGIGAFMGGPAGASMGYSVGSGVGSVASALVPNKG
jgi:L-lactate utilization protein LutC